jgi:hypothetical protein
VPKDGRKLPGRTAEVAFVERVHGLADDAVGSWQLFRNVDRVGA